MKKILLIIAIVAFLAAPAFAFNSAVGKGTRFVTVTLDGSTSFDLCDYLGVKSVALYSITQGYATNGALTVHNGSGGPDIYGPFVDTGASGLMRYYNGTSVSPYIVGTEASAGLVVTFEAVYVTK